MATASAPPRGTVTFLFSDVQDSSELAQRHPDRFQAMLDRHTALVRAAVEAHGGVLFEIVGDELCVAFPTARQALAGALAAQRALRAEPWEPAPLRVRMGINTGAAEPKLEAGRLAGYTGYATLARVARVMAAGHGEQVLLSGTSAGQLQDGLPDGVGLRDLGRHRLKGLLEPTHLWQALADDLPQSFPPLRTMSTAASNLPALLTRFVGRRDELGQVGDLLAEHRLVSLVGPGGTGKTRLALQVADDLREDFGDLVYLVDLARTDDPEAVLPLVARAVGLLEESAARSLLDDLREHLGDRRVLLVLDNAEQVLDAGPALVDLLGRCPGLTLLVTSREALRVGGEHVFPVPPMAVPDPDDAEVTLTTLAEADAVALFVDRARGVRPDFELTEENAALIARVCASLDGLPLAIELATARLALLSPEALVERLGRRLELLQGGPRDAPARQQTLRDTIGWSHDMLDRGEKALFALLSVFAGASVEAVEAVAARVDALDGADVFDDLRSLVDKSLVRRVDRTGSGSRLAMLETIREYAAERLAEDPALADAARRAHAEHFADWTAGLWDELTGSDQDAAADRMVADLENVRAAWRFWVEEKDFAQLGKLTDSCGCCTTPGAGTTPPRPWRPICSTCSVRRRRRPSGRSRS